MEKVIPQFSADAEPCRGRQIGQKMRCWQRRRKKFTWGGRARKDLTPGTKDQTHCLSCFWVAWPYPCSQVPSPPPASLSPLLGQAPPFLRELFLECRLPRHQTLPSFHLVSTPVTPAETCVLNFILWVLHASMVATGITWLMNPGSVARILRRTHSFNSNYFKFQCELKYLT